MNVFNFRKVAKILRSSWFRYNRAIKVHNNYLQFQFKAEPYNSHQNYIKCTKVRTITFLIIDYLKRFSMAIACGTAEATGKTKLL